MASDRQRQGGGGGALVVRAARPSDLEVLVRFNCALALESERLALGAATVEAGVGAALADPSRGAYRVAELAGEVVGALLVTREWSDWRNGWIAWIQSVYVAPGHRRRGVYSALHRAVERELAESRTCVALRLYVEEGNVAAQATYRELGMRPSGYLVFEAMDAVRDPTPRAPANSHPRPP